MPSWPTPVETDYNQNKAPRVGRVEALRDRDYVLLETPFFFRVPEVTFASGGAPAEFVSPTTGFHIMIPQITDVQLYFNWTFEAYLDDAAGGSPAGTGSVEVYFLGHSADKDTATVSGTSYADYTVKVRIDDTADQRTLYTTDDTASGASFVEGIVVVAKRTDVNDRIAFRSLYCAAYWTQD